MYEVTSLTGSNPAGIGMYKVGLQYTHTRPRWGILPIRTKLTDVLTYRVYVQDGKTVAEERSLMTRDLGSNIPPALRDEILRALKEEGHVEDTIL